MHNANIHLFLIGQTKKILKNIVQLSVQTFLEKENFALVQFVQKKQLIQNSVVVRVPQHITILLNLKGLNNTKYVLLAALNTEE